MATYQAVKTVTLPCGENLSGAEYSALKVNSSGQVIKTSAAKDLIVGILASNPGTTAAGDGVSVALISGGGVLLGHAGAAITAGQLLVADATGGRLAGVANLGAIVADDRAIGVALEGAADGEIFPFIADSIGGPHTA